MPVERYKVSGQELCQHYSESTPLSQVFGDIEKELKDNQQVVCQFIVNGIELREEDESKFSALTLKDVRSLEYLSEKTQTLIEGVIKGWIDALPEMMDKLDILSQQLRTLGPKHQMKGVGDMIDNCQFLISSSISLRSVLGDGLIAGIKNWEMAEAWTQESLSGALDAFEEKAFAILANVVDYDLNHGLNLWLEILEDVQAAYTGIPAEESRRRRRGPMDRRRLSN